MTRWRVMPSVDWLVIDKYDTNKRSTYSPHPRRITFNSAFRRWNTQFTYLIVKYSAFVIKVGTTSYFLLVKGPPGDDSMRPYTPTSPSGRKSCLFYNKTMNHNENFTGQVGFFELVIKSYPDGKVSSYLNTLKVSINLLYAYSYVCICMYVTSTSVCAR